MTGSTTSCELLDETMIPVVGRRHIPWNHGEYSGISLDYSGPRGMDGEDGMRSR